jgi:hypothetical protein
VVIDHLYSFVLVAIGRATCFYVLAAIDPVFYFFALVAIGRVTCFYVLVAIAQVFYFCA